MSHFHDLIITPDDYIANAEGKRYLSIPIEVWNDLNNIFLNRLKDMVEEINWKFEVVDGKTVITVNAETNSVEPSWEFTVMAGIPQIIEESMKDSKYVPVSYSMAVHRSEEPWTRLVDFDKKGKGEYDPCKWARIIIDIIDEYCLHGTIKTKTKSKDKVKVG